MRISVLHQTRYSYTEPARSVLQYLRLTPRDHDGQHVVCWRIEPSDEGRLATTYDHFGNVVHVFSADTPLRELTLAAEGEVETVDTAGVIRNAAELVPDACFLRETELSAATDPIRAFAASVADPGGSTLATLHRLMFATAERVRFDVEPTDSGTTADEAFALRRGVCQDLTHVFLAAARHLGIPSRYVSGYFRRDDGVVEQVAGHAWAESLVPGLGWVGFDPTNVICTTEAHVRVAIGLDYHGAAPVRGSRRGGGNEVLEVRLRVDIARRQGQSQSQS
ncbi:transglutaminase family protein [Enterovirga sp.]|uniref:transglutaminase family protein n=1 Tax=Enterovirga sp. TaxID=2026350 RepID=UPI002631FBBD|nr:transglutaminase family protein [Enterovirga sp.]MDB5590652.1 transglutaminase domain protein [Enterovirga sp.]